MAITYPRLTLGGTDLTDPSGRWELLPGSTSLPALPSRAATKIQIPGMPGEKVAAYIPQQATTITLKMRFNAISEWTGWKYPSTIAQQHHAIRDNINLFMIGIGHARNGYLGQLQLRNYINEDSYRYAEGYIAASAEPEWNDYADFAEMTILFENPSGSWKGGVSVRTGTLPGAGKHADILVPAGSAPSWDNIIAFKGPLTFKGGSSEGTAGATNTHGLGFRLGIAGGKTFSVSSTQWIVCNTNTGKAGIVNGSNADGTQPKSWGGASHPEWVRTIGRPQGPVLHLLPEPGNPVGSSGYTQSKCRIWRPNKGKFAIRSRRRWY